ncbi:MAG: DUF84 family protein [Parcubacteria group bacterium]|nr:DUF84 family protein [Parcubacteria group bacterium]
MEIYIGSTSDIKYKAVQNACNILEIEASINKVKLDYMGQNAQPVGFLNTSSGSSSRASRVKLKQNQPDAMFIGIENGVFKCGQCIIDIAVITIFHPEKGRIMVTSQGIEFPYDCFNVAEERGFNTTTVGQVIAEKMGGSPDDPHSTVTGGKTSREELLTGALLTAFSQLPIVEK